MPMEQKHYGMSYERICITCIISQKGYSTGLQGGPIGFTPEIEVFHMVFESCHAKNRKRSIKQHIKY